MKGGSYTNGAIFDTPMLFRGTTEFVDGAPRVNLRMRSADASVVEPANLDLWCISYACEHDYAESEAYARRLARAWHAETFVFDHWIDNGRLRHKTAAYRFIGASSLQPHPGTNGWGVTMGKEIALPSAPYHLPVAEDLWNALAGEVDDACGAFHRIAALMPADTVADKLAGPRVAVEHCRAEAHRLAAIGHELDDLPRSDAIGEAIAATEAQLCSTRDAALGAVGLVSTLGLQVPCVFIDDARVDGDRDLAVLSDAIGELADNQTLGSRSLGA
jgi:hypothetical protein